MFFFFFFATGIFIHFTCLRLLRSEKCCFFIGQHVCMCDGEGSSNDSICISSLKKKEKKYFKITTGLMLQIKLPSLVENLEVRQGKPEVDISNTFFQICCINFALLIALSYKLVGLYR